MKWKEDLAAAYDIVTRGNPGVVSAVNMGLVPGGEEEGGCFYENVGFEGGPAAEEEPAIEPHIVSQEVYDFPRPRSQDNLYINENFDDDMPTYDTPRKKEDFMAQEEEELDMMECEYDIPRVREATLTPIEEEEAVEYAVPRSTRIREVQGSEENLYQNQQFASGPAAEEPIYMNELGDGGSSGYRSSSSPSIHSEENLYENHVVGSVVGSLEELSIKDMQVSQGV